MKDFIKFVVASLIIILLSCGVGYLITKCVPISNNDVHKNEHVDTLEKMIKVRTCDNIEIRIVIMCNDFLNKFDIYHNNIRKYFNNISIYSFIKDEFEVRSKIYDIFDEERYKVTTIILYFPDPRNLKTEINV